MAEVREMSTQRKLTDDERRQASEARVHIVNMCRWKDLSDGPEYWSGVSTRLLAMVHNGTTDGKPYVEPQPPMPDGWREWAVGDEGRVDAKFWSPMANEWQDRPFPDASFTSQDEYIVPIDRTPTDTDAQSLPIVMVRDYLDRPWEKSRLVRVTDGSYTCLAASRRNFETWSHCRHLYSGE